MNTKFLLICFLYSLLSSMVIAQVPQGITIQTLLRNSSQGLISNQSISVRISILQGSITGTTVYSETHHTNTNDYGLCKLDIGRGGSIQGSFIDIDWGQGPYYVVVEVDNTGGANYQITTSCEFLSVAYALFADTAAHVGHASQVVHTLTSDTSQISSAAYQSSHSTIGDTSLFVSYSNTTIHTVFCDTALFYQERQVLSIHQDSINLTGGSYVLVPIATTRHYADSVFSGIIIPRNTIQTIINDSIGRIRTVLSDTLLMAGINMRSVHNIVSSLQDTSCRATCSQLNAIRVHCNNLTTQINNRRQQCESRYATIRQRIINQ